MAWYNTGTIALTNGSATVTGSGTNFLVGAQIGEALYAPDGKLYEIQTINSATVITLASNYLGSTASGQGYQIIPTQSLVADLASDVTDLISDFANVRDYAGNGKFNDGAVGTPGITFTQDQDNGLYRIGSNNWALAAGGIKQVDLSATDVEINYAGVKKLATSATGIDVTGTVTADVLVTQATANTYPASAAQIKSLAGDISYITNVGGSFLISNSSTTDQFVLTSAGNVGMGTSSPFFTAAGRTSLSVNGTSSSILAFGKGGSSENYILADAGGLTIANTSATLPTAFFNNGSTRMTIDASGKILIGDSASHTDDLLQIETPASGGGHGIQIRRNDTNTDQGVGRIQFGNNTASDLASISAKTDGASDNGALLFNTTVSGGANTERMRIDASGNLGIGTDSPNYQLTIGDGTDALETVNIVSTDAGSSRLFFSDASSVGQGRLTYDHSDNHLEIYTADTERMRIDSSGNLLVQETVLVAPNFKIQGPNDGTAGMNIGFVSMGNSNGGYPYIGYNCAPTATNLTRYKYVNDYASWIDFHQGQVRTFTTTTGGTGDTSGTAGPYVAGGGTSWTSSSDRRLKDDVQAISYGLDAVKALEPVSYVRNDRDIESRELGFIAQDVEGVVDEVVNITDDGYYGLDYQRLIPVLTKAIQEQQATIEALTARIAALES